MAISVPRRDNAFDSIKAHCTAVHQAAGTTQAATGKGKSRFWRMLSLCCRSGHYDIIAVQITIRDVPEEVRDVLAARAASEHRSMQEFLRRELERIASLPTLDAWMQTLRERKDAAGSSISTLKILRARDADRR